LLKLELGNLNSAENKKDPIREVYIDENRYNKPKTGGSGGRGNRGRSYSSNSGSGKPSSGKPKRSGDYKPKKSSSRKKRLLKKMCEYHFLSDNSSGVHENVLRKISEVNQGFTFPYGKEKYTAEAEKLFSLLFGLMLTYIYCKWYKCKYNRLKLCFSFF
jgi:hypothetical protein